MHVFLCANRMQSYPYPYPYVTAADTQQYVSHTHFSLPLNCTHPTPSPIFTKYMYYKNFSMTEYNNQTSIIFSLALK